MRIPLALALLALGACADAPPDDGPTITVRGLYVQPVFDGQAMRVDHEAIPGRMPAMAMDFRLDTPALLDGLEEGSPVRLTLDSTSLDVVGVETLPAGTELALESGGEGGAVFVPGESR